MKTTSILMVAAIAIASLGVATVGGHEGGVQVLIDFGDGTYVWAEVHLPESNRTAIKATQLATGVLGLSLDVTWFESTFCLRNPCALVNDIGNRTPIYPVWWHFYVWNDTSSEWEMGLGASDTDLDPTDEIAWYLAVDDPVTFASPTPAPRPGARDVWTSFRGDALNRGLARGNIPSPATPAWDHDVGILEIDTTPVVAYGKVFVAARDALVALDAETGVEVWRTPGAGSLLSTPAVYDGRLILGGTDGRLRSVDAATGAVEWDLLLEPGAQSTGIASSPTIHEGRAYVGTFNESGGPGRVAAVNLHDGTVAWSYETGSVHLSQPAIGDGVLYVGIMGTYDGVVGFAAPYGVLSLTLEGEDRWFFPTEGPVAASPVLTDGRVFVTAKDGFAYALTTSGSLAWKVEIGPSVSSMAVFGSMLFAASGGLDGVGSVFRFDPDGSLVWEADVGAGVQASPVTDGAYVCIATNEAAGRHVCLHASTGTEAWSFRPEPAQYILGSPVVAGDRMFAVSDNGHVYAFEPDAAETPDPSPDLFLPVMVLVAALLVGVGLFLMVPRRRRRA